MRYWLTKVWHLAQGRRYYETCRQPVPKRLGWIDLRQGLGR